MTNLQTFPYSEVNKPWFDENLPKIDALPDIEITKIYWGNLLGEDNKEIIASALYNSPQLASYIDKTRQDFIKNHANLSKYPKLSENDWK